MSKVIYQSKITAIGGFAKDVLADGMLITFKQGAPSDLADYCFIHSHGDLLQSLSCGQTLTIGKNQYVISAIGDVATQNLKELGHVTLRFDASSTAELPGSVHVIGETPVDLNVGDEFVIAVE